MAAFDIAEPVIEIGLRQYDEIPGQSVNLRSLFPGRRYLGCNISAGPGVDRIEDITQLTFQDGEAGTLICLHIMEHGWDVFSAFKHIRRVIKTGGMAIVVCPCANMPNEVFGIGFNQEAFPGFDARVEKFRSLLERVAHDPSTWFHRMRTAVGSGLCKKKNFQSFLPRNDLTLELVRPSPAPKPGAGATSGT